ncbi:MAG: PilZ domain-containing protein [Novosphingobium sp.]|uniref:PilZ domain-containing protein n=1 Tax=Novosphingobium sp. TaxID=1874826 RepID=UPI00301ACCE5
MKALSALQPAAKPHITGRRAMPRVRLCIPAQVLLLQGLQNCQLDDLSQTGASVTLAARMPEPGAGVVLKAKGLDIFGTVVWSEGARFGIAFEEPLPLHDVVNVRHFADSWAEHEAARQRRLVRGRARLRPFA